MRKFPNKTTLSILTPNQVKNMLCLLGIQRRVLMFYLLVLLVQIIASAALIVAFARELTVIQYNPSEVLWEDIQGNLYWWPLMMLDPLSYGLTNRRERIETFTLWLSLEAGLWFVWMWTWPWTPWKFIPTYVVGLPIATFVGMFIVHGFCAVGETMIQKLKKLGKLTAPVRV